MLTKAATFTAAIGAALLIIGTASTALAQESPINYEEYEDEGRGGLLFGVAVSAGHLQCEGLGCDGATPAGGLDVHIGLMLSSKLAIVGDVWSMAHMEDRVFINQTIATIGPQLWLGDRLWLRAGVGAARAGFNYDAEIADINDMSGNVLAATAGAGFELVSSKDFALDLHLKAGSGFYYDDPDLRVRNIGLGLGATWY